MRLATFVLSFVTVALAAKEGMELAAEIPGCVVSFASVAHDIFDLDS